jgi:eukaryotic-like serine/threonine-protein kinase
MAFSVGDHLGRFEIVGSVGAGGMGEVYRARDPQLQRDVAIKVLPAEFFDNADRRRRFEQEARAAGGLNHPNILAVFDIGVEGPSSYMVTELLEGETLRQRMGGHPLPARKAIDFGVQIASGLAAAHDRGVVHRDIKPENLFVTTDGRIKILDFGLAKVLGPDASGNTETVTIDGIERTTVVGTVAYMSPEQARGMRIDHRTDIFSFGVVLYEMLAGFPPFRRATVGDTINAILHDDATALPKSDAAIPALERLVHHCLEKKPEERFQNFRDLAFDLESRRQDSGVVGSTARRRLSRRAILAGTGLIALAAAAGIGALAATWLRPAPQAMVFRVLPMTSFVGLEEFSSISPDGKMLAFTAEQGKRNQIVVRFLTGTSSSPLPVTTDDADHQLPRWSPDGSALLYFSPAGPGEIQGAIYRIPTLGGPPQRVIGSIGGGDVGPNGRVACFRLENDHIQLVTSTLEGSEIQLVAELPTRYHAYPRWSPDNQWIAFQAGDGFRWDVYVVPARGGQPPIPLTNDNRIIRGLSWLPDSTGIVYASARGSTFPYLAPLALWEVRWSGRQPPSRIPTPHQLTSAGASYEQPDVHAGELVSVTRMQMSFDIWKYPFDGTPAANVQRGEQVTRQTGQVATPTAAPAGDEIAYLSDNGGHANVWITSPKEPGRQITPEEDPEVSVGAPVWSPDGKWIAIVSSKGNIGFAFGVWLVKPDGSELHQLVPKGLGVAWSEDGQWLYYVETASTPIKKISVAGGPSTVVRPELARNLIGVYGSTIYFMVERQLRDGRPELEIHAAPLDTAGPVRVVTTIPASRVPSWQVMNPSLSPDGKWLAVPLTDGFTTNIWALSTDDGRWKQVTDFGDRAIFIARRVSWSADGRSIFAAVGQGDADIVLLDGLIKGSVR